MMKMMKIALWQNLVTRMAVTGLVAAGVISPVLANTFGHKEVNQNNFIAVATPLAMQGNYQLLVIEQISSKRNCWSTFNSRPQRVNLLLSNFDFTDICRRSTDSNGYSIRAGGEDIGMQYRLRLQKQGSEVVLLGRSIQGTEFEIGRTNGLADGPMKIQLNPRWRLTKQTYNGETTGRIYFTSDRSLPALTE